jgi:hypothetical protein
MLLRLIIGLGVSAAGMILHARLARNRRLLTALFVGALLTGSALSAEQSAPLRESARLIRSEGESGSALKKALAALASVVSAIALGGGKAGEETPLSP